MKDENQQKHSPKFHRIFRQSLARIAPELRSGGLWTQQDEILKTNTATSFTGRFLSKAEILVVRGKGDRWPRKGNGTPLPPEQEPRALLFVENAFNCNGSPLIIVGNRVGWENPKGGSQTGA